MDQISINIKILPRFTKPSVVMTLYKKSTKTYLILLHFNFINVHIDRSNKYGWIEEANKFLSLNVNIFAFFKKCFCVIFLDEFGFYN